MKAQRPLTPEKALIHCETLCAKAEHSAGEIRAKLRLKGLSAGDIDRIITSLIERRFIDDERFARAYVRDKVTFALWGVRKIALGLRQKGVSRQIADQALSAIDRDQYIDNLRRLLDRKRCSLSPELSAYDANTRLFRFAISRGFEPDVVATTLRQAK